MPEPNPTVRARALGAELRRLRERTHMSATEVARRLDMSQSKISRMESGKRGIKVEDVASLLTLYRVTGRDRDELLGLSRDSDEPGWLQRFGDSMPKELKALIDQEATATGIRSFETMIVPGLLQTNEYARASMRDSASVPPDEVEELVAARMARQTILTRDQPPRFSVIIAESALRWPIGDAMIMAGQLRYLVERASRPHIEIRVLPFSAGAHPGFAGAFTMLDFPLVTSTVFVDNEVSRLFLDQPDEIAAYNRVFARLASRALDAEESKAFLASLATELAETV